MMKENIFISSLFFAIILATSYTSSALIFNHHLEQKPSCVKHCRQNDSTNQTDDKYVHFELGKTYVYELEISNQILFENEKSKSDNVKENLIQINGRARLSRLNQCEVSMVLENVHMKLLDYDSRRNVDDGTTANFVSQLQRPIIFSYMDGIVTEVCSPDEKEEDPLVINIKKSIISTLQTLPNILNDNRQIIEEKVIETDYHGECETEYHIEKNGTGKFLVVKQKDLLKCAKMNDPIEWYDIGFLIQDSKEAISKCRQQIESQHVVESECSISHSLNISLDYLNMRFISQVHLTEVSVQNNSDNKDSKNNLILSHRRGWLRNIYRLQQSPTRESEYQRKVFDKSMDLENIVNQICQDIKQNSNRVGLKTVEFVRQLSQVFQYETNEKVKSVWKDMVLQRNICNDQNKKLRDIFVDVAASVLNRNTAPIVLDELLRLYNQQIEDPLAKERLRYLTTSMAFAENPSREAIKQIVRELLTKIEDSDVMLSISALFKSPHMVSNQDRSDEKFKEDIYKIIVEKVLVSIQNPFAEVDSVRLLKMLENIAPRTAVIEQEKLIEIINGRQHGGLVRSSAIKSMEGVQTTQNVRKTLIAIFSDTSETNEIRIVAYLTLMNTGIDIEELKQIFDVVKKEQDTNFNRNVYNYVCSHQKILRNTKSLPVNAPEFPEPASITEVFLSRHYEYSNINSKTSLGSIIETDVIMANKSDGWSIPRLITVNLTIPIGSTKKRISIAEVTIRQEGFDESLGKKILDILPRFLKKRQIYGQLFHELNAIVESSEYSRRRLQLLVNVDGKNVFVYDSSDKKNHLIDIWTKLREKFPIRIDETMVVMPWQKRVIIEQTSSGVPMYLEINLTYIGSLETIMINQNQSLGASLEMILKPTIIAQTNIGIGSDDMLTQTNRFHFVNRILVAPMIHFKAEIKDNQQFQLKFMLPEKEQIWWHSETKIIKGQNNLNGFSTPIKSEEQLTQTECLMPEVIMKFSGLNLCKKNKKTSLLIQKKTNEILVDYTEVVLKKQNEQMEGLAFVVELPEQLFELVSVPLQDELKFGFSVSTISKSPSSSESVTKRFQTEMIIHVPNKKEDQLMVEIAVGALKKKFHGKLVLVDNVQEKSMKLEIKNEKNTQLFLLDMNNQVEDNQNEKSGNTYLNFNIYIQPFDGSTVLTSKGIVLYKKNENDQKQFHITFEFNKKRMVDAIVVQDGHWNQPRFQLSLESEIEIFDRKLKHRWLYNKEQQKTKSISKTSYNIFGSNVDQFETFDVEYQSSTTNDLQSLNEINLKQFFHYKMISTQYPQINLEVFYNRKMKTDLIDDELIFKYGKDFERNQLRVDQSTHIVQNNQTKETFRLDTKINWEFKPKNLRYFIHSTTDIIREYLKKQVVVNLEVQDRKDSRIVMKSNFRYEQLLSKLFHSRTIGEIKFPNHGLIISYKDNIKETDQGKYRGKITLRSISLSDKQLPRWLLKRAEIQYTMEKDKYLSENILKQVIKFEHDVRFENDYFGTYIQSGLLEMSRDHPSNFYLKTILNHESKSKSGQVYQFDIGNYNNNDGDSQTTFFLNINPLNQLLLTGEVKWNLEELQFIGNIMMKNIIYDHKTSWYINKSHYDLSTETSKIQLNQMILLIKSCLDDDKNFKFQTKSKFLEMNVEMNNFLARSFDEEDSHGKIEVFLPKLNVDHVIKIKMTNREQQKQDDSITIESQTRHKSRNILKFNLHSRYNMGTFQSEFGGDLRGEIKVERIGDIYQLNIDIQAPKQQITHQTKAQWQQKKTWPVTLWKSYRLLSMDMKNYLGERNLFDIYYEYSDRNDQQYQNQLMVSTRMSHSKILWSQSKALIMLKTKFFGGVEHQTELNEINLPSFKLVSKTRRNDHELIQLFGDIILKNNHKSLIKMILGDDHVVQMQFVPMNNFQDEYRSNDNVTSSMGLSFWDIKNLLIDIKGENRWKNLGKWEMHVDHKSNDYTKIQGKSQVVQGDLEYSFDTRSLKVDLKGNRNEHFEDFEHQTYAILDKNWNKFQMRSQTNKAGKKLVSIDTDYDKQKLFRFNSQFNLKKFPIVLNILMNFDERIINFQFNDQNQNRQVRFETKAKEWNDFRIQYVWSKLQDPIKKFLLESKILSDGENKKASVIGQWLKYKIELKIDFDSRDLIQSSYKLQGKYNDLETSRKKMINFEYRYNPEGIYETVVECQNDLTNILTGHSRLNVRNRRLINFEMETETDLDGMWNILNSQVKFFHKSQDGRYFQQNVFVESGTGDQKKLLHIDGQSNPRSIIYKFVYNSQLLPEQTAKIEWDKLEQKLQINVYNQHGRIVDINVDVLSKALQKKFQIVSFTNIVPTIDVEAAFGEDSYLVFEISFQKEKKMQLSLNWFGQWRRDYRAEILFQHFDQPEFEMMITSHHPAMFDSVDAVFKYRKRNIKVKWDDKFDDTKQNGHWEREAIIEVDGRKVLHLNLDRKQRKDYQSPNQEIISYDGRLDGDYRARGKVDVIVSKPTNEVKMIRLNVEDELMDQQEKFQHYLIELFFGYQEQPESPRISGITIERDNEKPLLIATYVEPSPTNDQSSKVNTLAHLYLPGDIDYKLLNEISYQIDDTAQFKQIKQIRSQLKKKEVENPLADVNISYDQEENSQAKVVRIEVRSPNFLYSNPKVFKLRYNLDSSDHACHRLDFHENSIAKKVEKERSCVQIILGDETSSQKAVSVSLGSVENLLKNGSFNKTILFSVDTLNEPDMGQVWDSNIIAHLSTESIGYKWEDVNRFGNKNSGQFYLGLNSTNETKIFDYIYQYNNEKQTDDESYYRIHIDTKNIFKKSYIGIKWNLLKIVESWIFGGYPKRIEEHSHSTDFLELPNEMIQELKNEIRYKWSLFKRQVIDSDLITSIIIEARNIENQMKSSQNPVAIKMTDLVKKLVKEYEETLDLVDFEQIINDALVRIYKIIKHLKKQLVKIFEQKCFDIVECRNVYRKLRDYEIRHLVQNNIQNFQDKFLPKLLMDVLKDFEIDHRQQKSKNFVEQMNYIYDKLQNLNVFDLASIISNSVSKMSHILKQTEKQTESKWPFGTTTTEQQNNHNSTIKMHIYNGVMMNK